MVPRTFVFAGKAAPGYAIAKKIISLINHVAEAVNSNERLNDKLKVAQTYKGQIIVDAYPMDIRPDMNEEQAREVLTKYVSDFKGLAAFTTQVFDLPPCPRQYELQYEISRKLFNPD